MDAGRYDELKRLRKRAKEGADLPIGGKSTKMGLSLTEASNPITGRKNRAMAAKAYDQLQNMREEDVEIAEQRAKDARGYKSGGFVRAADGVAKKGKTKGRFV